jgi:hypothetical protein
MAAAVSTASNNTSTKYHTVNVCTNLPRVEKNYPCKEAQALPPADYWTNRMNSTHSQTYRKVQHIMANDPRK